MSESPKFVATTSVGIFLLATAIAWGIIATANPYSGANLAMAAIVSCPIYFLGVLASIRVLRLISFRSPLGWVALGVPERRSLHDRSGRRLSDLFHWWTEPLFAMTTRPNKSLQRMAAPRSGCERRHWMPPSLSLGR